MSGVIPAIPLILIRPFLPESPAWQQKKDAGTLKRPSIAALFSPELRRTTIVTTIMFAMAYGAAFGAIQQIPQIVPGLPEVREDGARACRRRAAARITQETAASVTQCAGDRRPGRTHHPRDPRRPDRQPPAADAAVPGSRA